MRAIGRVLSIANELVRKHMFVKKGEEVLLMTDMETDMDFARAIGAVCRSLGAQVTIVTIPPSFTKVSELTKTAEKALEGCDVYIPMAPTTGKAVHSRRVAELLGQETFREFIVGGCAPGGIPIDIFVRTIKEHDYEDVYRRSKALARWLADKKEVHVTSQAGTDFTCSIESIFAVSPKGPPKGPYKWCAGIAREPGELASLPDGEAWGGPREGTTEGVVVVNGTISSPPICLCPEGPSPPVKLTVKEGRVVKVEGGAEAKIIRKLMDSYENYDNFTEVAFGTNRWITELVGHIEWDKKSAGTMHVALGCNLLQIYPYGTKDCEIHTDMVLRNHTAEVDGEAILKEGKLLWEKFFVEQ